MFDPNKLPEFNTEEYKKKRFDELRQHIVDNIVKPNEYYQKGEEAKIESGKQYGTGTYFKNELIGYNPNLKAEAALQELSEEVRKNVTVHGIASNQPGDLTEDQAKKFPLFALLQILATGKIKGDSIALQTDSGTPIQAFTDAPFILLSNKGEPLLEVDPHTGESTLKNLRTILVNGQYESMVDDLRKRFSGVSFRTAEQIDDAVFDKKNEPFKSFEDQINDKIANELENLS